jgi:putative endonuclease
MVFEMNYIVYVLKSENDEKRYIGLTTNIDRRLWEHNSGLVKSTRNRRPLNMVYKEVYATKGEAQARERFFKTGKGREYLNTILATYPSG